TADGKSSQDIADILILSKSTVDFHVKNAVVKLQVGNKTAAVVRAAVLGYLN
ncbi:MAG: transcriptional activator of quorum sensing autoinducer synthesis transcription regulator protein, partial [Rhodoferax sp.]|nr:transcriptional activator of quorum sensing autoinducer synthesis transcription regulator protein [Rhodoferax sp.]